MEQLETICRRNARRRRKWQSRHQESLKVQRANTLLKKEAETVQASRRTSEDPRPVEARTTRAAPRDQELSSD